MIISAKVKSGSKKGDFIEKRPDGTYIIYVRARAHDGEANTAVIEFLSKHFDVPKTSIRIKTGASSHLKLIEL